MDDSPSPHLQIIVETDPTPGQRASWTWLWKRLLGPENTKASTGGPADQGGHEHEAG